VGGFKVLELAGTGVVSFDLERSKDRREAERRAAEAEARLAEFTASPKQG
jgi:hypothetical protein